MKAKFLKVCGLLMILSVIVQVSSKPMHKNKMLNRIESIRTDITAQENTLREQTSTASTEQSQESVDKLNKVREECSSMEASVRERAKYHWAKDILLPLVSLLCGVAMLFSKIENV